jgi:hypothetical protein
VYIVTIAATVFFDGCAAVCGTAAAPIPEAIIWRRFIIGWAHTPHIIVEEQAS